MRGYILNPKIYGPYYILGHDIESVVAIEFVIWVVVFCCSMQYSVVTVFVSSTFLFYHDKVYSVATNIYVAL